MVEKVCCLFVAWRVMRGNMTHEIVDVAVSTNQQTKSKKRKHPCPNCKTMHPGRCPEPRYRKKRKTSIVNKKKHIASLFG